MFTARNVSALTDLVPGGIRDVVPQDAVFPFVWYELSETQDVRGFGSGGLPEVELRVHAFGTYEGMKEVQDITQQAILLLKDQALTVSGYTQAGKVFYDRSTLLFDQLLNGVKVHELVSAFRIFVEED